MEQQCVVYVVGQPCLVRGLWSMMRHVLDLVLVDGVVEVDLEPAVEGLGVWCPRLSQPWIGIVCWAGSRHEWYVRSSIPSQGRRGWRNLAGRM